MQDTWQKFQQELQEMSKYGDCKLCGEIIESGLSIEPFGNCCDKCVNEINNSSDTHCDDCDNSTDTPCTNCLWDESVK